MLTTESFKIINLTYYSKSNGGILDLTLKFDNFWPPSLRLQHTTTSPSPPQAHSEHRKTRDPSLMRQSLLLTLLLAPVTLAATGARRLPLNTWSFHSLNDSVRVAQTTVPGTSHTHLQAAGVIDDPYARYNELDYRWVAADTWVYETRVDVAAADNDDANEWSPRLVFEQLDGIAHVFVNDQLVAATRDSFLSYTLDVSRELVRGSNAIKVIFSPTLDFARQQVS